MAYNSKHTGAVIDQQIDRVIDGSVVVENTLSALDETSNKPVSGGAVAKELRKFRMPLFVGDTPYNERIKALYIEHKYISDSYTLLCKSNGGYLYIRPKGTAGKYAWQAVIPLEGKGDNEVYPILTTVEGEESVPIGTMVGYIIYSDIDSLSNNTDYGYGEELDTTVVTEINSFRIFYQYVFDTPFGTDNIEDKAVTMPKLNYDPYVTLPSDSAVYRETIEDIWLNPIYVEEATHINVRCVASDIIIRAYKQEIDGKKTLWTFRSPLSALKNGELLAISLDEVYGYIMFKDIDTFMSHTSYRADEYINISLATLPLSSRYHTPIALALNAISINSVNEYPSLYLPSNIYCVQGDELRIYYKSIIKAESSDFVNIKVVSEVGKAYPKYYCLKSSEVGQYDVVFTITNNLGIPILSKATTINIIPSMLEPSAEKKILVFGASATATGHIAGELKRRLTDNSGDDSSINPRGLGLSNITFVGRKMGTANNVAQEATGGWSWRDYSGEGSDAFRFNVQDVNQINLNDTYSIGDMVFTIAEVNISSGIGNIRCTYTGTGTISNSGQLVRENGAGDLTINYTSYEEETFNPFWNDGKLDFTNYANKYCGGSIDVIISHCGMNDMSRYDENNMEGLFEGYIKPFIRAYHNDFPEGIVIISTLPLPDPTGGMGASYGASDTWNWSSISRRLWRFAELVGSMCDSTEFSSYVSIADSVPVFDSEHSYPYEEMSVNTRSSFNEKRGTNGVHPTTEGSYQVSDAIYGVFNKLVK